MSLLSTIVKTVSGRLNKIPKLLWHLVDFQGDNTFCDNMQHVHGCNIQ